MMKGESRCLTRKRRSTRSHRCILKSSLLLAVALALGACATNGSPTVTINKNQTMYLVAQIPEGGQYPMTWPLQVTQTYETTSSTALDAAIEQQLKDLLKTAVKPPLPGL